MLGEWIVIVDLDQPSSRRPKVLLNEDLDDPHRFESIEEIKASRGHHPLGAFVWHAVNFMTGECLEV